MRTTWSNEPGAANPAIASGSMADVRGAGPLIRNVRRTRTVTEKMSDQDPSSNDQQQREPSDDEMQQAARHVW